ncbi:MAG: electron transport complex subunit E [bacterium]
MSDISTAGEYRKIFADGLWNNNTGLVQLLGLCPLLAVTGTAINGLGLGLATLFTLMISNVCISLIRNLVRPEVRIPVFILVIASAVTVLELLMAAYLHELHLVLGIFIPLIVTNCAIIGRAEAFAAKNTPAKALADAVAIGGGFLIVLVILGGMREIIGQGTLFSHAELLFGSAGAHWKITFVDDYSGFLLAVLPPGAFLGLGFLIAAKNIIDDRRERKQQETPVNEAVYPSTV